MDAKNDKSVTLLNGLIEINNDRITGYEKAASDAKDSELKSLFQKMSAESKAYRDQLNAQVTECGGTPAKGTTTSGKVYHAWMDIKSALTGDDTHALLSLCEFGEDAALEAYDDVLDDEELSENSKSIVMSQRQKLQVAHNHIKALRDTVKEEK